MTDEKRAGASRSDQEPERTPGGRERWAALADRWRTARLARQIRDFAKRHGGNAEGQLAYLGQVGARIVLVGENGQWGDLTAPSYQLGRQALERAGIQVRESFDGELAAKVRTGRYEWSRMAGMQIGGPRGG
ncbi:hypothetical protein [Streptomyces sp. TP-A0874]|uniref:hypothetical protein n=1 Tax=Streptomyces sp. TP-A0874 TaxID=549819 RepID=UPI001FCE0DD8|nr:hypothetical protein [Streptomyces sp. TP-A0874]